MVKPQIQLSPRLILEQEFKIDTRGYRLKDVDRFLDVVIKDYQTFGREYDRLAQENKRLKEEVLLLKRQLEEERNAVPEEPHANYVDLIKRISRLEREVFEKYRD